MDPDIPTPSMTAAQNQVFREINELLREHFYGSLIIVNDGTPAGQISTMQYNGGLLMAIGMARAAERKLIQNQMDAISFKSGDLPEEEEEEA
jgi:hypothetical protein